MGQGTIMLHYNHYIVLHYTSLRYITLNLHCVVLHTQTHTDKLFLSLPTVPTHRPTDPPT